MPNAAPRHAVIGKDCQAVVIQTSEGRTLTGLVRAEDQNSVTLATATEVRFRNLRLELLENEAAGDK